MSVITITFNQQVQQSKNVDLPAFVCYAGSFYKIISSEDFVQIIPESLNSEVTVKKWKNANTVTKLLSDPLYAVCSESDFTQAYQSSLTMISNYVL
jgi:hypothetical protein